jgi:hypothetical protein
MKNIKKLYKSSAENEEDLFDQNYYKQLISLLKLAEKLKGHKITEHCYKPEMGK